MSCIWQSHPRLLTQDLPAPGRNSKDTKAIYRTTGTYTGFLVWVRVVYIYEIHNTHAGFWVLGEKGYICFQKHK